MNSTANNKENSPDTVEVRRCGPSIGAEIRCLDLSRPLSDADFAAVHAALLEHKIIFFRGQDMTAEQQLAFARRFGEPEHNPFRPERDGMPEVQVVKNDRDNPVLSTDVWHADLTFRRCPTKFTILRCVEMPACGGDTLWADMAAAYDGLSPPFQEFITGLSAVHDFKNFRVLYTGDPARRAELQRLEEQFPNPVHPVVSTHPDTRRRVLFVNRQFTVRITGMSETESHNILEILYEQARVPEYQFRLSWEPGTLAIWDNRSCQHYAANDYYPQRRHMERVAVAGDAEPVFDPDARPEAGYATVNRVHAHEDLK